VGEPEVAAPLDPHIVVRPAGEVAWGGDVVRGPQMSRSRSGREPHRAEPLLFCCTPRRHQPAAASKASESFSLA
jgi:hypothetical protein